MPMNANGQAATVDSNEVSLELLKEAGQSIRASWDLVNNLIRNFLYLNLILFTIFGVSLKGFDSIDVMSNVPAKQSGASETPANKQIQTDADNTAKIIKVISFMVCVLGILGPIIAGVLLNIMLNYGRRFLAAANNIEKHILCSTKLEEAKIGFYHQMYLDYEAAQEKRYSMKKVAYAVFVLFGFAWVLLLLIAIGYQYFTLPGLK